MPRINKIEMDRWLVSGSWKDLEKRAANIVSDAEASAKGGRLSPLLGGGTRLMLELSHRISRDIDLFIRDPQWIGLMSPRLNDKVGDLVQGYEEDATFLKLKFSEGEIDFIVRMSLTGLLPESSEKSLFLLEPVEEVLAKKLDRIHFYHNCVGEKCLGTFEKVSRNLIRGRKSINFMDKFRMSIRLFGKG